MDEKDAMITRLRKALDAVTDFSIYPDSIKGGPEPYAKRSPYQDGWNDCAAEALQRLQGILENNDWPDTAEQAKEKEEDNKQ